MSILKSCFSIILTRHLLSFFCDQRSKLSTALIFGLFILGVDSYAAPSTSGVVTGTNLEWFQYNMDNSQVVKPFGNAVQGTSSWGVERSQFSDQCLRIEGVNYRSRFLSLDLEIRLKAQFSQKISTSSCNVTSGERNQLETQRSFLQDALSRSSSVENEYIRNMRNSLSEINGRLASLQYSWETAYLNTYLYTPILELKIYYGGKVETLFLSPNNLSQDTFKNYQLKASSIPQEDAEAGITFALCVPSYRGITRGSNLDPLNYFEIEYFKIIFIRN